MPLVDTPLEELIARLSKMKKADRRAVLNQLSSEERGLVERNLQNLEDANRKEIERQQLIDRQFLGYSPWVAKTVEASEKATNCDLTTYASETLWAIHLEIRASRPAPVRKGWFGILDSIADIANFRLRAEK